MPNIEITKEDKIQCDGCGQSKKGIILKANSTWLKLCHTCKSWLKGKLQGV